MKRVMYQTNYLLGVNNCFRTLPMIIFNLTVVCFCMCHLNTNKNIAKACFPKFNKHRKCINKNTVEFGKRTPNLKIGCCPQRRKIKPGANTAGKF